PRLRAALPGAVAAHLPVPSREPNLDPRRAGGRLADLGRTEARDARDRDAIARGAGNEARESAKVGRAEASPAPDPTLAGRLDAPAGAAHSRTEPVPRGRLDAARLLRQPG